MPSEVNRIRSVKRFLKLNLDIENDLQEILSLAASICNTPIALITLLDAETQWMRVRVGTDMPRMPRDVSFCNEAIRSDGILVVPDLSQDDRFSHNPMVTDGPKARFYAGAPLIDKSGHRLGTLCVVDHSPQQLSAEQIQTLLVFSGQVMRLLELKLSIRLLEKRNQRIEKQKERILAQTEALQEIAYIQSHEVRSPVASILGLVNLIQLGGTEAATEYLPLLEEAATQLDRTIKKTVGRTYETVPEPDTAPAAH